MAKKGRSRLSREERGRPVLAIVEVFEGVPHELLRMGLWKLLKSATSEYSWNDLEGPESALELQGRLEKLLEACHLLLWMKEKADGEFPLPAQAAAGEFLPDTQPLSDYRLNVDRYKGSILRLSGAEVANPYVVVKSFFGHLSLTGWKELLDGWVEHALSNISLIQDSTDSDLILRYEFLEKLLEVSYLFYLSH